MYHTIIFCNKWNGNANVIKSKLLESSSKRPKIKHYM